MPRAQFPTFYANVALVSHRGDDLCIDFRLVAPPQNVHTETKTISIPVIVQVITSSGLADGLIEALRIQLAKQSSARDARRIVIRVKPQGPDSHALSSQNKLTPPTSIRDQQFTPLSPV